MRSIDTEGSQSRRRNAGHATVLALFIVLAVAHTWPLASRLDYWSRHDNADAILNEWVLAWIGHILPQHPLQLFNAPIFYPEPRALAFSEHMIVQGVFGLPLFALGVSPLLVYNVVLLSGFVLTAFTMYFLIAKWTGDRSAAVLAGMLAAFNAHVFTRMPHLQALHVEFVPLVLLLLDRMLSRPRIWTGVLLGIAFALQGLTSYYWLVFITFGVAAAALVRYDAWWGRGARDVAVPAAAAAFTAAAMLLPFLWPYYRVSQHEFGLVRSLRDVSLYSAGWRDYFSTPGRLHLRTWSYIVWGPGGKTPLFAGFVCMALAGVALAGIRRDRRVLMLAAVALVSLLLSLGTNLPGYPMLYDAIPLLRGIRAPVRAGHLVLVALAALAGIGLAQLRRGRSPRVRAAVALAAMVLATVEVWVSPLFFRPGRQPSSVVALLKNERRAVVACFPMAPPNALRFNDQYMLDSMLHWKPMLNGFSGMPASYVRHWEALKDFPAPSALAYLKRTMVTHVVVYHPDAPPPTVAGLERIASENGVTVFRVRWDRIDDTAR